ncbi:hypothetical protein JW887_03525 [Candidatus Dojkabacteria bacterium]|nr:hypothetical protein [Candidatus Dojkabacteria bacterium]
MSLKTLSKIVLILLLVFLFVTWCTKIDKSFDPNDDNINENINSSNIIDETGIEFAQDTTSLAKYTADADVTSPGEFERFPSRLQEWKDMVDNKAYFRDLWVAQITYITNANDGDEWTCKAYLPDGSTRNWGSAKFYSEHNGQTNCFVTSTWTRCNTDDITLIWYTKSQCAPTGEWIFEQYYNGLKISSESFELLPHLPPEPPDCVPLHAQKTSHNATIPYDHLPGVTIYNVGCALTSAVMLLGYYGIDTTPEGLNEYLINYVDPKDPTIRGYGEEGEINWPVAITKFSNGSVKYIRGERNAIFGSGLDDKLLNTICEIGPQILNLKYWKGLGFGDHFVVGTGRVKGKDDWHISDSVDGQNRFLSNWSSNYWSVRWCEGPEYVYEDFWCRITLHFHSPGDLVVTDPSGKKVGYDPISDITFNDEIPNSNYDTIVLSDPESDLMLPETKELEIWRPIEGEYELQIIGTGTGNYNLEIYATDREGSSSADRFSEVPISPGKIHTFLFDYSRESGTFLDTYGVFDGKGQRPRDVNKFLSYSQPTQVTTELTSGEMSYELILIYSENINPSTFTADLNGQDISNFFDPAPNKYEIVNIDLSMGRNTLILSVEGTLDSGRSATDKDRLVFIVK